MVAAICAEVKLRNDYLGTTKIDTVYFGGGTPGILTIEELESIFETLQSQFELNENAEITLEVNPENINAQNLIAWKNLGINRLSIGIQSLNEEELKWMNRSHTAEQAVKSVELALSHNFDNLNIDLIFGSPLLNHAQWQTQLEWAFNCGANHISAYALTVENKTQLHKMLQKPGAPVFSEEHQSQQYRMLNSFAYKQDWDFYEISNLSKKGHHSRHNSAYWTGASYLGLGPSAHSFNGESRSWNISSIDKYIEDITNNTIIQQTETLDAKTRLNEYIMTGIRRSEGVDLERLNKMDAGWTTVHADALENFQSHGWINIDGAKMTLTLDGRLMADYITAEFFTL